MPMRIFQEDTRFRALADWARADKTVIFCTDPKGCLWETSARLTRLNKLPGVVRAEKENRLLVVYPDHRIEAGFLCMDNDTTMRTFRRGQEQAQRLLPFRKSPPIFRAVILGRAAEAAAESEGELAM